MNHFRSDRGAINVVAGGILLIGIAVTLAGWWAYSQFQEASGSNPQGIDITITSTRGTRDVNRDPFALIEYKIDYKSDPLTAPPLLRCEMTQVQTSGTRRFVSDDANAPITARIVTGTVTIGPGPDNRAIEGEYDIRCQLIRGNQVVDQATGTVDIPDPDADPTDLSRTGRYTITAGPGASCRGSETYDFSYRVTVDANLNEQRIGKFTLASGGSPIEVPLGGDFLELSFSFNAPVNLENPFFGGTITGRFVTEIDRVFMVGTAQMRGTADPDCSYDFKAPRQ